MIVIIDTIATGEVKTVNLVDRKGTVMIDVMATMIGNDTRVVTEIIKAATADDRTTITTAATTTGRILIPLPDAQREVAPGHGEIQSHARVVTNLLVVDTEAEIGEFLYPCNSLMMFEHWLPYPLPVCSDGLFRR